MNVHRVSRQHVAPKPSFWRRLKMWFDADTNAEMALIVGLFTLGIVGIIVAMRG